MRTGSNPQCHHTVCVPVSALHFKSPTCQLLFSYLHTYTHLYNLSPPSSCTCIPSFYPPPCNIHTHKQPRSNRNMRLPIVVMTAQDWRPSTTSWRRRQISTTTSSARTWINSLDLDHSSKGKDYGQYMWQSWVEIEHYSVVYFDCIAGFEAL